MLKRNAHRTPNGIHISIYTIECCVQYTYNQKLDKNINFIANIKWILHNCYNLKKSKDNTLHRVRKKGHVIFDYNSRLTWWIFKIFYRWKQECILHNYM